MPWAWAPWRAILNRAGQRRGSDLTLKFLEHFAAHRARHGPPGLWDETDGFAYDRLVTRTAP